MSTWNNRLEGFDIEKVQAFFNEQNFAALSYDEKRTELHKLVDTVCEYDKKYAPIVAEIVQNLAYDVGEQYALGLLVDLVNNIFPRRY